MIELPLISDMSCRAVTAVLSLLLLLGGTFVCWTSPAECCGHCDRMPTCQGNPVSADRLAPSIDSSLPVLQVARIVVDTEEDFRGSRSVSALRIGEYSPTDIFLINSAFLI